MQKAEQQPEQAERLLPHHFRPSFCGVLFFSLGVRLMQRLDADARSTLTSLFFLLMQQPRHKASIHVESKASTDSVSTWSKSPKVPFRTAPHQNDPHVTHTSKSNNPRANGLLSKNKGGKKTSQTEAEGVKKCAQINKMNRRTKKKKNTEKNWQETQMREREKTEGVV